MFFGFLLLVEGLEGFGWVVRASLKLYAIVYICLFFSPCYPHLSIIREIIYSLFAQICCKINILHVNLMKSKRHLVIFLLVLTFLFAVSTGIAGAVGNTYWVDDDSSGGDGSESSPFTQIQEALDVAEAGDTIRVRAGVYTQYLVIEVPDLSLIGDGPDVTVIDPGTRD